ncbi:TPA: hypothetical protein ACQUHZ_002035, partial [Neisseria cinerea]
GGNIQRLSENSEVLDSHFRGNDGGAVAVFPINDPNLKSVIPAQAGIQTCRGGNLSDKTVSPAS